MTRAILLQISQVLAVLSLAPLLQGIILQWEERVQRAQGPGIFQPYRDLWKLFHKQLVVPETASFIYWATPVVAFTCMLTVPLLIPVLTNFPLPLSDMGDILGGGLILDPRLVPHQPRRARLRQRLRRHRLIPGRNARDSG